MYLVNRSIIILSISALTSGCESVDFSQVKEAFPFPVRAAQEVSDSSKSKTKSNKTILKATSIQVNNKSLVSLIDTSLPSVNVEEGFSKAIKSAVDADPSITASRSELVSRKIGIEISEKSKNLNISGTLLGGIEDISDGDPGIAAALNASRMIYDGGQIDAQVLSERFAAEAAEYSLKAKMNQRAVELAGAWVDLTRYSALSKLIGDRLNILNPLIIKLEQVADAGMGDITQVSAAQRTVSSIKATQLQIGEKLELATLNFNNSFGAIPTNISYDSDFVDSLMPNTISGTLKQSAPALLSAYASYKSSEAQVVAVRAKESFYVGLEARATRPMGDSTSDSEERIGLVLQKTLYNGKLIESEGERAEAAVSAALSNVKAVYREGLRQIENAQQIIVSMDSAISLAKKNAKVTSDEIVYLRKQLIIGGSTLDKVLSAEARLYDAESQEINFIAEKRRAQLTILGSLGLLAPGVGLSVN